MSASRRTVGVAANAAPLAALLAATPARLAIGRTGPRLPAAAYLAMVADHARARDAITSEVPAAFARKLGLTEISTRAHTRAEYVRVPALGRTLDAPAIARLRRCRQRPEVQLALTDGLSSAAIVVNGPPLLRALRRRLLRRRRRLGTPLFVRNGDDLVIDVPVTFAAVLLDRVPPRAGLGFLFCKDEGILRDEFLLRVADLFAAAERIVESMFRIADHGQHHGLFR